MGNMMKTKILKEIDIDINLGYYYYDSEYENDGYEGPVFYEASVKTIYKGCKPEGNIIIGSLQSQGLRGYGELEEKQTYELSAVKKVENGTEVYIIDLCGYNYLWKDLNKKNKKFLRSKKKIDSCNQTLDSLPSNTRSREHT